MIMRSFILAITLCLTNITGGFSQAPAKPADAVIQRFSVYLTSGTVRNAGSTNTNLSRAAGFSGNGAASLNLGIRADILPWLATTAQINLELKSQRGITGNQWQNSRLNLDSRVRATDEIAPDQTLGFGPIHFGLSAGFIHKMRVVEFYAGPTIGFAILNPTFASQGLEVAGTNRRLIYGFGGRRTYRFNGRAPASQTISPVLGFQTMTDIRIWQAMMLSVRAAYTHSSVDMEFEETVFDLFTEQTSRQRFRDQVQVHQIWFELGLKFEFRDFEF